MAKLRKRPKSRPTKKSPPKKTQAVTKSKKAEEKIEAGNKKITMTIVGGKTSTIEEEPIKTVNVSKNVSKPRKKSPTKNVRSIFFSLYYQIQILQRAFYLTYIGCQKKGFKCCKKYC